MAAPTSPYTTTDPAAADALRALGCRYEDLDKPPLVQDAEDVMLITTAQVAAMQAEIVAAHTALREVLRLARAVLSPRSWKFNLTYEVAIDQFGRIEEAAQKAMSDA